MIYEINPIAIDIFGLQIAWYAICIMTGIFFAVLVGVRESDRLGIDRNLIYDGVLYCVPLCIVGARLYYVLFDWDSGWDLLKIIGFENGSFVGLRGLAINGGIITAGVFVVFYCIKKKISVLSVLDLVAPGFLIGQICGRWGNFFNQEAHGPATTYEFLSKFLPDFIVNQMRIDGTYYHPTFLYELSWNFLVLIFMLIIRRTKKIKVGDLFPIYLMCYGFFRGAIIEPLRTDPLMMFGVRANVVINLTLCLLRRK